MKAPEARGIARLHKAILIEKVGFGFAAEAPNDLLRSDPSRFKASTKTTELLQEWE